MKHTPKKDSVADVKNRVDQFMVTFSNIFLLVITFIFLL